MIAPTSINKIPVLTAILSVISLSVIFLSVIPEGSAFAHTTDITNKPMSKLSARCVDYVGRTSSFVEDVNKKIEYTGSVEISETQTHCRFETNAIPNHDFNDGKRPFRNDVSEQNIVVSVVKNPDKAAQSTPLSLSYNNAVFLNGVQLDLLAAACYGVGRDALGREKIGCGDDQIDNPWRYDPLSQLNDFGTDSHYAHAQPDGSYHYHGGPGTLYDPNCEKTAEPSPVVGFAADGFPIYGPCFDDNGVIRKAISGFVLKSGVRQPVGNFVTPAPPHVPGDSYDGQFRGDYEYRQGEGDLDECNGMTVDGQYAYYISDTFPWVINCFTGTPDASFAKRRR